RYAAGWRARHAGSWTAKARCASPPRLHGWPKRIEGIRGFRLWALGSGPESRARSRTLGRVLENQDRSPEPKARSLNERRHLLLRQRKRNRDRTMRGIIFDLDDTLYPRERFIHSGMAAVSRHVEQAWKVPADMAFA